MENASKVLSLLFFAGTFATLYWGYYITRFNIKRSLKKTYILICLALGVWSFGFGMVNLVDNMEEALLWRRFSSVGMTLIFSLVLHFIILLTNQVDQQKNKKYLYLLHVPSLIAMYFFVFSSRSVVVLYNLDYGVTNIASNSFWNYFYYLYYGIYSYLSLYFLFKWKKVLKESNRVRQANVIIMGLFVALIIGTVIDIVLTTFLTKPLPQMAPLFVLIPVWALHYSARHHGMLDNEIKEEAIISKKQERQVFIGFSIGLGTGGLLSFFFEFLANESNNTGDFLVSIAKGSILIFLGIGLYIVQKFKNDFLKEKLTIIILISSIPIITFQFINFSAITVWAYSILIIISALLFNKRTLLNSVLIVATLTQTIIWILQPEYTVVVDKYDFMLRILIIGVAFFLGTYLNRVYINKIKENNYQIAFQKLVSDITLGLVGFNKNNSYEKLNNLLKDIGKFFNADRVYIFTINNNETMTYSNEWCNIGVTTEVDRIEDLPLKAFTWWINELYKNRSVLIKDVSNMPKEANPEQVQLYMQGVKSVVSVPINNKDKMYAFIGMDIVYDNKQWTKESIDLLKIIANILSSVLTPMQIDEETKFRAYNDGLTKLPNRYLFAEKLTKAIDNSTKTNNIAVIFIDLDDFKTVNDTTGHVGGDLLLKQLAASLDEVVREVDIVARFGGDEFLIMLDEIDDINKITNIVNKVMDIFSNPFIINKQEFFVTASAGIAVYPFDGDESDTLIKNADIAMYKAKNAGKNQYMYCTEEMKEEISFNTELSNDLIKALEKDEFIVYYQPQVDLLTNKIMGIEALIRWEHPTRGIISPGIFIPLAEKSNLINNIGDWVLKTACLQVKKWQDMGLPHLNIAVNLSAVQMINPNITKNIQNIIKETNIDPKYINLEITESAAIEETAHVLKVLNKLVDLGVSISIDDFGIEYSSLSRLKILPVNQIKIDMEFVQGIETNDKDKAIIMIIINLANKLGLSVLAEGVETKIQLDFLRQEKCDYVQGYYFYKPEPASIMEEILVEMFNDEK